MKKIFIIFSVGALCVAASVASYSSNKDSKLMTANIEALAETEGPSFSGVIVDCARFISSDNSHGGIIHTVRYCGTCGFELVYNDDELGECYTTL